MKLVIVESPSKAKTIEKYLGKDFQVIASFGHIRDLPSKEGSVDPEKDFAMVWSSDARSQKQIKEIVSRAKLADEIMLATDPDREGEAISWHILEILKEKKALKDRTVKRVVFHEITKKAIVHAVDNARDLDDNLIDAYLARRALDYLVGFSVSPVLWRKLPGSRSAGRVQSVALRLITDRETEIEAFEPQEYWSILGDFLGEPNKKVQARLTHLGGKKLDKFSIAKETSANEAVEQIKKGTYSVSKVTKKQAKRNPAPPFTTSTLQQEASRKLGFGATNTMRLAQQLYEGINIGPETTGLITYMRTDSVNVSDEAISGTRDYIGEAYGKNYVPKDPRAYKSKAKNAQEAHEAIRPTDISRTPQDMSQYLDAQQLKLYSLVWKRAIASQMESAIMDKVSIDIATPDQAIIFRATGSTIHFDGFLKVYKEGFDAGEKDDDEERILPKFAENEYLSLDKVTPNQHFTAPPPRYGEASLVKKLEELGIGRPSTYASIINTLQDRGYVRLETKQFHPEDRGRLVTTFLVNFFEKYVEYDFTANLEEQLDEISDGKLNWKEVLNDFWKKFDANVKDALGLTLTQVIDSLNKDLDAMLFPADESGADPHKCPKCKDGDLSLKLGRYGSFIGCSKYPDCQYTRKLGEQHDEAEEEQKAAFAEPKVLGRDEERDIDVTLRKGPYGFYFQWGEPEGKGKAKTKPKRAPLPKDIKPEEATLEDALDAGALPRILGNHPETDEEIEANVGRYGPYVKYQGRFISLKEDDPKTVSLERAVEVITNEPEKKFKRKKKK